MAKTEAKINPIVKRLNDLGIDHKRLKAALDSTDNWGKMVNAFEFLTVCSVVCEAMDNKQGDQPL